RDTSSTNCGVALFTAVKISRLGSQPALLEILRTRMHGCLRASPGNCMARPDATASAVAATRDWHAPWLGRQPRHDAKSWACRWTACSSHSLPSQVKLPAPDRDPDHHESAPRPPALAADRPR